MKRFWITNLILFQACWLCAAFFTEYAALVMPLLLALHFMLSPSRRKDLLLLLLLPIGFLADKIQLELGVFSVGESFFPFWLLLLWAMFLISLNHGLSWLDNRSLLTLVLIGALGGASSYWGGIKAGVIDPLMSDAAVWLSLMLVWGCLLPLFVTLKRHIFQHSRAFAGR